MYHFLSTRVYVKRRLCWEHNTWKQDGPKIWNLEKPRKKLLQWKMSKEEKSIKALLCKVIENRKTNVYSTWNISTPWMLFVEHVLCRLFHVLLNCNVVMQCSIWRCRVSSVWIFHWHHWAHLDLDHHSQEFLPSLHAIMSFSLSGCVCCLWCVCCLCVCCLCVLSSFQVSMVKRRSRGSGST